MRPHQYHVGELLFKIKDTKHFHSSSFEDISISKMNNVNCSLYSNISSTKTRDSSTSSIVNNTTTRAYIKPIKLVLSRPSVEKKKNIGLFLLSAKNKTILSKNREKINKSMSLPIINKANSQLLQNKKSSYKEKSGWYFNVDSNEREISTVGRTNEEIKEKVFHKLKEQYKFVHINKKGAICQVVNVFKRASKVRMKEDNENKMSFSFWLNQLRHKN